jgi:hypothetical protein
MPRLPWDVIEQIIRADYLPPIDKSRPGDGDPYNHVADSFSTRCEGVQEGRTCLLAWAKVSLTLTSGSVPRPDSCCLF